LLNQYKYDQLNRLLEARSYESGLSGNTWSPTGYNNEYFNKFEYDANGNILTQKRHLRNGTQTDDLTCNPCGCFCLRGHMPTDRYDPDKACFPETIKAIFELVSSSVYAGECQLNDFEVDLVETDADRTSWQSETQTL
jgi:hypothetical protein